MISYKSTRGLRKLYTFPEVILQGIAPDGGLFVPVRFPWMTKKELRSLTGLSYQAIALYLLNLFQTGISYKLLNIIVKQSYGDNFDQPEITPLVKLRENQFVLELWHGPTSAFKDMALQIKPILFSEALKQENSKRKIDGKNPLKYLILVATSGDTGKAALEGYKDRKGISVLVFYPAKGVSKLQELSMTTQEGDNLAVFGMKGNFDDVQRSVKDIFNDREFNKMLLEKYKVILSSANSINWGRLLPQIIYHIRGYTELVDKGIINCGDEINIAVPTGNFGNILAALYAKKIGLPVKKLICASNENNILTEFLETGTYDIRKRKMIKTPSPSMDMIIASNLERMLFEMTGKSKKINKWMKELKEKKIFQVDKKTLCLIHKIFVGGWITNEGCLKVINKTYYKFNYLTDPHTAVAIGVVDKTIDNVPTLICSTAHWAKFGHDVHRALSMEKNTDEYLDEFEVLKKIQKLTKNNIPKQIYKLRNKKILHHSTVSSNKEEIEKITLSILNNKSV